MEEIRINKIENNEPSKELIQNIRDFYYAIYKEDLDDGFIDESILDKKINGEINFYKKILNSVNKAQKENLDKKIILLFDIDETLVSVKRKENGYDHIIRPSAINLLQEIQKIGAVNGILTTRDLEAFKKQLDGELKDFKSLINQDYVYSSRGVFVSNNTEEQIKKENESFASGDIEKVFYLNNLIKENKDNEIFVPVDDLQYPALYPNGIALKDDEKFYI